MLKKCTLNIEEKVFKSHELASFLETQKALYTEGNACLVYEGATQSYVCPLATWNESAQIENDCLRLVLNSRQGETRIEKEIGTDNFYARCLTESEDKEGVYYKQDNALLLRESRSSIDPAIFAERKGRMLVREYYKADADGMLIFFADRLCGSKVEGK